MTIQALKCEMCGGAIAFPHGNPSPICPYCGASKQVSITLDNQVIQPDEMLDFWISEDEADQSFREFASSSFWYPKDIRNADLELKRMYLPAWIFSGDIESHYCGLIRANSRSGYRPVSGIEKYSFDQILVPSSKAINIQEINAISPFPNKNFQKLDTSQLQYPYEPSELSERVAIKLSHDVMRMEHGEILQHEKNLTKIRNSAIFENVDGHPALFPIFIGVYRRKDKYYRIVINGCTAKLSGNAPFDWVKLLIILLVFASIIGLVIALQ